MALIDHVNWKELDRLVLDQQRNRSAHAPVISLFRWWARRPHCFASALLDAATLEFGNDSFLVADPFSGGGTVAFEAVRRGLPIYAQDLYPWPSHGLATALTFASAREFENAASVLLERLKAYRKVYWSKSGGGESWETTHVIRVRTSTCISCAERLFLFREPLISLASRKADETFGFFGCRACGAVSRRKKNIQSFASDACQMRSTVHGRGIPQRAPLIKCPHCLKSIELSELLKQTPTWHPALVREHLLGSSQATAHLRQAKPSDPTGDIRSAIGRPFRASIPDGLETGHLTRHGFQFWEDLYTQRQLTIIFGALEQLETIDASEPVKQHLRLAVLGATEMAGYVCRWERYNPKALEAIANHRFSRSTVTVETNLLSPSGRGTLPRRFEAAAKALRWMETEGYPVRTAHTVSAARRRSVKGALVVTGSSERQLLKDGAARLVFTDPPYHDDLQYGELSRLFHAWMAELSGGKGPCEASEAVPNAVRGTDTKHYEDMVAACLTESNRTLTADGRLVLTFHNKDLHAWEALAGALLRAKFSVVALATVSAENPSDHSKRGKASFLSDLVIECCPRGATVTPLRKPKVLGVTKSPERRNLAAIGLALAEHVNTGIIGDLQPLFQTHLKALKTSRVLISRGGR
jgi:putative DNA methylase